MVRIPDRESVPMPYSLEVVDFWNYEFFQSIYFLFENVEI